MKAVLFDANGVLYYRAAHYHHFSILLQQLHLPVPSAEHIRQVKLEVKRRDPGATRAGVYDAILAAYGVTDPALRAAGQQAAAADSAAITLYDDVIETLAALKTRGFKLGVVTNSTAATADKLRWLHAQGLTIPWDAFVNSYEVGVHKPDRRLYEVALEVIGVTPAAALYIGHDAQGLTGARAVGLATVAFACPTPGVADYYIAFLPELLDLPLLEAPNSQEVAGRL